MITPAQAEKIRDELSRRKLLLTARLTALEERKRARSRGRKKAQQAVPTTVRKSGSKVSTQRVATAKEISHAIKALKLSDDKLRELGIKL